MDQTRVSWYIHTSVRNEPNWGREFYVRTYGLKAAGDSQIRPYGA